MAVGRFCFYLVAGNYSDNSLKSGRPTVLRIWFARSTWSLNKGWSAYFSSKPGLIGKPASIFFFAGSFFGFMMVKIRICDALGMRHK